MKQLSVPIRSYRVVLSPADVKRLDDLGERAAAWRFDTGSWDGDELYMHCQLLDMERVNTRGFRYSHVSIGCNHPRDLMPLVNEVARLARLRTLDDGKLYY